MIHLTSITVREFNTQDKVTFPFTLEIVKSLREIQFTSPVTFFVGENGSGKSTVMEAIACAVESITVGSESVKTDKSLAPVRNLAKYFRLAWTKRTRKGFFCVPKIFSDTPNPCGRQRKNFSRIWKILTKNIKVVLTMPRR
jgi:predicted ATPase